MTDISKCGGGDNPLCDKCWRFLAPASTYQYFLNGKIENGKCYCFITRNEEYKNEKTNSN